MASAISQTKNATIKFVIRVISYANKTTFPSLMSTTKATRKNTRRAESLGMKMSKAKKGTSWKSRLQFDIDRMIKQSKDWDEFLRKMAELGYEIKYGNILLLSQKMKPRFTRAKTIGEDYTEERLKERLAERSSIKPCCQKRIGIVIDMNTNMKSKRKQRL